MYRLFSTNQNEGKQNFDGVLAMALMNAKGEIREIISSSTKTVKDLDGATSILNWSLRF